MKTIFLLLTLPLMMVAAMPYGEHNKIVFQNSIVAKVNDKTISMMDVKKRLDLVFHKNYPQLINSTPARFQFYQQSWKQVLMEMIDHELIITDALDKEIKLTDGEVREEMERRFGPNTLLTLDKIGLSYDEAMKIVKDEMIVQRMTWWFIQARALQNVTPEDIRQAYRAFVKSNPSYKEWKYRVISVKGENAEEVGQKVFQFVSDSGKSPDQLSKDLEALGNVVASIQVSDELVSRDIDLSETYKNWLSPLEKGEYSEPVTKLNRQEHQLVSKILYCEDASEHPAPKFEDVHTKLRDQLTQEAMGRESIAYITKLRKKYGYDEKNLSFSENFEPFSVE